jgi:hypothetical protein
MSRQPGGPQYLAARYISAHVFPRGGSLGLWSKDSIFKTIRSIGGLNCREIGRKP